MTRKVNFWCESKHPTDSPDYISPDGAKNDNNNNPFFMDQLRGHFGFKPFKLLDLGCAGGQLAVDVHNIDKNHVGIGLEGSNEEMMFGKANGSHNWKKYNNECLFSADISKPFKITDDNENIVKFDIVTAWDFFEHPTPEQIPDIIENIKPHLKDGGIVVATISWEINPMHRCVYMSDWWDDMFRDHGFLVEKYPFWCSPRGVKFEVRNYAACFRKK